MFAVNYNSRTSCEQLFLLLYSTGRTCMWYRAWCVGDS